MSLLLALPGGASAAVAVGGERNGAVVSWWDARARRAQQIIGNHDRVVADLMGGG